MSGGPKDASLNGEGFRFYRWEPADGSEPTDVLSVTSIRKLCGEPYNLVAWQLANLADAALGTQKRTVVGPRGGVSEKRQVWEFPSEFARMYEATEGNQGKVDDLRKWLREQADAPRNIAAVRGTIVHEAIEKGVAWDRIEEAYVENAFANLSSRDRAKVKRAVNDEDVSFVRNGVRHYWDMRKHIPWIILGKELQVFNLTAGYAGSFDALVWVLGSWDADGEFQSLDPMPDVRTLPPVTKITIDDIRGIGGTLVLLDYKTSKDVHTDQVVQAHAYLSAEFVGTGGVIDQRMTDLLEAAQFGGLAHVRPNGWALHLFAFDPEVVRAFLGSVAFARFLAKYPRPETIFAATMKGQSEESDEDG